MTRYSISQPVRQVEAPRLMKGEGRYTDDILLDRQAHAVFLRSPHAHADILRTDTSAAKAMPGVIEILTGEDWAADGLGDVRGLSPAKRRDGSPMFRPPRPGITRDRVRHIRYGITGVEAAMASTGSMLVISGKGANRSASLLPFRHIALIPFSRLYRTIEEWLAEQRAAGTLADLFHSRANLTLISGPSKSADIEMALTLGVHGPKFVHAILFDDSPPDDDRRYRPSDLFEEDGFGPEEGDLDDLDSGGFDDETTF